MKGVANWEANVEMFIDPHISNSFFLHSFDTDCLGIVVAPVFEMTTASLGKLAPGQSGMFEPGRIGRVPTSLETDFLMKWVVGNGIAFCLLASAMTHFMRKKNIHDTIDGLFYSILMFRQCKYDGSTIHREVP